ncbi:MAG: hypothetical protein JWO35_304 [Candidatus Saccharibacteria bacterium]|nr:hypothetical protein [Candidatus Saccharibacteria bacterium]
MLYFRTSRTRQKGFAAIEVALLVVILGIIGGTSFFVYHSNQQAGDALSSAAKASGGSPVTSAKKKVALKTSVTTPTVTAPKYLTIKEWAVRLPLTSGVEDAYYIFRSGNTEDAYLSLRSLETTMCAADQTTVGAISRFSQNEIDPQTDATYLSEFPEASKVGAYYYRLVTPQAECSADEAVQTKAVNARVSLSGALKSLQAE